ncbi:MAG: response regulator [Proteobacteria bacterium]|nr:response regulator [Pseudomonadota bacterium]
MAEEKYKSRILVVDDNQATLFLFRKILEKKYTLHSALGGREALKILQEQEPPDLILSDIIMPEMSGYDLFHEIKKDPRIASIPIIFVTALGTEADELKGLETGAVDYIVKPIEHDVLTARINNILELYQYNRDNREQLPETPVEVFPEESIELPTSDVKIVDSKQTQLLVAVNPDYDKEKHDLIEQELSDDYELVQFKLETEAHQFCIKEKAPDLILLDVDHSEQDRFEIIKLFKNDEHTRSIPVMLLTSIDSIDDETTAFQAGCADYLSKPIIPPILKARIRIHIELKRHRQLFKEQLEAFMDE